MITVVGLQVAHSMLLSLIISDRAEIAEVSLLCHIHASSDVSIRDGGGRL